MVGGYRERVQQLRVTEQQWNEFLDKLDFVQLTDRWQLLPLRWLDPELPSSATPLARDMVAGLLELREESEGVDWDRVRMLAGEYRRRLSSETISLDSRLTPPGSRVTLSYLDPENLGEGDCLITVGSWDRLGHLIAEAASPGGDHLEHVGDNPVRREPGKLNFRHLLLFPDKGTPSPRAFRALCEKTLRQARGLGARHLKVTHLHLPQTGLADRFAAAELVSALRQMLRESPGSTVDILAFSHRNFEDYRHWFDSLKELSRASSGEPEPKEMPSAEERTGEAGAEVGDTLRNLAKRSTELASEATASVSRWFQQAKVPEGALPVTGGWTDFGFHEKQALNLLYLGRWEEVESPPSGSVNGDYLSCLLQVVRWEGAEDRQAGAEISSLVEQALTGLSATHPLTRYFELLLFRLSGGEDQTIGDRLITQARAWEDRSLLNYLSSVQEECGQSETNPSRAPVYPAGCRLIVSRERTE